MLTFNVFYFKFWRKFLSYFDYPLSFKKFVTNTKLNCFLKTFYILNSWFSWMVLEINVSTTDMSLIKFLLKSHLSTLFTFVIHLKIIVWTLEINGSKFFSWWCEDLHCSWKVFPPTGAWPHRLFTRMPKHTQPLLSSLLVPVFCSFGLFGSHLHPPIKQRPDL